MKRSNIKSRAGFTMAELIAVIAIIGILTAIAVPSIIGFIESGKQTSRTNIARTLYLGAQNRLTELRITKSLKASLTSMYYDKDANGKYIENESKLEEKNVYSFVDMPDTEDPDNENYVQYISKPKGTLDPNDPVIMLLDPVILDKNILYDAILIEYNIKTGVVLSVFYGDAFGDDEYEFLYEGGGNDRTCILGERPYSEKTAKDRKQGYYGVGETGNMTDPLGALIYVYDSYQRPLPDDEDWSYKNVLYAEMYIPVSQLGNNYDLQINGTAVETGMLFGNIASRTSFAQALSDYGNITGLKNALAYRYDWDASDIDDDPIEDYSRIIWVLDYVGGNMTEDGADSNVKHSIWEKYATDDTSTNPNKVTLNANKNLNVGIGGTATATSFTTANPYFFSENSYSENKFTVMSARHLYNIRYYQEGLFTQRADIDLATGSSITNFAPIPELEGTYTGTGYAVKNLSVDIGADNAGLFGTVKALPSGLFTGTKPSVMGLTLENPSVKGGNNVGSVCGINNGFITGVYVSYNDETKLITGGEKVGGIVGENNKMLTDSTFVSSTDVVHISGENGTTGGIAGSNEASATIKRVLFLALAPEVSDIINPIVGGNKEGAINESIYYLSGTAIRPTITDDEYNTGTDNGTGEPLGTEEMYALILNTDLSKDWKFVEEGLDIETRVLNPGDSSPVYPYPYNVQSQGQTMPKDWPIVEGVSGEILFENIAYYEIYEDDNSIGLWFANSIENGSLKNDKGLVKEAGYIAFLEEEPSSSAKFYLYARDADTSATNAWTSDDSVSVDSTGSPTSLEFKSSDVAGTFEKSVAIAVKSMRSDVSDVLYVTKLPLNDLAAKQKQSKPLQLMCSRKADGTGGTEVFGGLQPLFAKGLYPLAVDNPVEFYVRTPWQMKNISVLTANSRNSNTDYTSAKTFKQEINIDFTSGGVGVGVGTLEESVVTGTFNGIYDGANGIGGAYSISNVTISVGNNNAGLFLNNAGTIENISIIGIDVSSSSSNSINIGGITAENSGTITNITVENATVKGSATSSSITGGITAVNTGTSSSITNVVLKGSNINGTANVGGVAGTNNGGTIEGINLETVKVTGSGDNIGGVVAVNGTSSSITTVVMKGSEVNGTTNVGGIAGTNTRGTIEDINLETVKVTGSGANIGGIVAVNGTSSSITRVAMKSSEINGTTNVGGVAGTNTSGTIEGVTLDTVIVTGNGDKVGGVTAANIGASSSITTVVIKGSNINGTTNVGGVAGTNNGGTIEDINLETVTVTGSGDKVGGISANNTGSITDVIAESIKVTGKAGVGGVTAENSEPLISTGAITTIVMKNLEVEGTTNVGGVAGTNSGGSIEDVSIETATVKGTGTNVGGVTGYNFGLNASILKSNINNITVTSNGNNVGGIAGNNSNGSIEDATVKTATITGVSYVSGVAGANSSGSILEANVETATVTGSTYLGGIAGNNLNSSITEASVKSITVKGIGYIGGITGLNSDATITGAKVNDANLTSTMNARNNIGGIAGSNTKGNASITNVIVENSTVTGNGFHVGGIVGVNANEDTAVANDIYLIISNACVINSTVEGTATYSSGTEIGKAYTGGIVGRNSGTIEDVFFLSMLESDKPPVSSPYSSSGAGSGGIAGSNTSTGKISRALYLAPAPSYTKDDKTYISPIMCKIDGSDYAADNTNFYLSGNRYSLNKGKNWTPKYYNYFLSESTFTGGGVGLTTAFLDMEWLSMTDDFSANWYSESWGGRYPYPMLKDMDLPNDWPITDVPVGPDQIEDPEWEPEQMKSDRAAIVGFVNGNFTDPYQKDGQTVDKDVAIAQTPDGVDDPIGSTLGHEIRHYVQMQYVNGWNTRPVEPIDVSKPYAYYMIELQEPVNISDNFSNTQPIDEMGRTRLHDYMYTDHEGNFNDPPNINSSDTHRYAELNALIPGTFYQVCETTSGAEFLYSFYHSTRLASRSTGTLTDKMNFYLTEISDEDMEVRGHANDSKLTLIRPCWSPRMRARSTVNGTGTTTTTQLANGTVVPYISPNIINTNSDATGFNPVARNTVEYYPYEKIAAPGGYSKDHDLSYYKDMFKGNSDWPSNNIPYLYDVWVSDLGYGITFWSAGKITGIPTTGISSSNAIYKDYKNNIIGYWGVSFGWKHYYGSYTVPEGQTRTEFAYQSAYTGTEDRGNYLDGVSFRSPSFMSVDLSANGSHDALYVKPKDTIEMEITVTCFGETEAGNIVITDDLKHYQNYMKYIGNAKVTDKKGAAVSGATVEEKNGILTVTLPSGFTLKDKETVTVTFDIEVLETLKDEKDGNKVSTLLYNFKNQAVVEYTDTDSSMKGLQDATKKRRNGSNVVTVFIDPVRLTKTVNQSTVKDGPFEVILTIENTIDGAVSMGVVTDVIPKDFEIVRSSLPENATVTTNPTDGSQRLTISKVDLCNADKKQTYTYTLEYNGKGYGVSLLSTDEGTAFRYICSVAGNNVFVSPLFPQPVVGISIKTLSDSATPRGMTTHTINLVENDNFSERMGAANYDVTPEVILYDKDKKLVGTLSNNNQIISNNNYTATLIRGTSGTLLFTPKESGTYEFYYRIVLVATKDGGTPPSFDLSSGFTRITINASVDEDLVYYEQYAGGYGFYYADGKSSTLKDEDVIESGYGVLSSMTDLSIITHNYVLVKNVSGSKHLYKLETTPTQTLDLIPVAVGDPAAPATLGEIHPNFAKALYDENTLELNTKPISIRTPQQMQNIGLLYTAIEIPAATAENPDPTAETLAKQTDRNNKTNKLIFTLERSLDFSALTKPTALEQSVVDGKFTGVFKGNDNVITNVNIASSSSISPIGLFSENSGTIEKIILNGDSVNTTTIVGKDYVGGIAGRNWGTIRDCTVEGDAGGNGMHIAGSSNVGGIAGNNETGGSIDNCTVQNTTNTIIGVKYVGGIAGCNNGTIKDCVVSNIALKTPDGSIYNMRTMNAGNFGWISGGGGGKEINCTSPDESTETNLSELAEELRALIFEAETLLYEIEDGDAAYYQDTVNDLNDKLVSANGILNALPVDLAGIGMRETEMLTEAVVNAIDQLKNSITALRDLIESLANTEPEPPEEPDEGDDVTPELPEDNPEPQDSQDPDSQDPSGDAGEGEEDNNPSTIVDLLQAPLRTFAIAGLPIHILVDRKKNRLRKRGGRHAETNRDNTKK